MIRSCSMRQAGALYSATPATSSPRPPGIMGTVEARTCLEPPTTWGVGSASLIGCKGPSCMRDPGSRPLKHLAASTKRAATAWGEILFQSLLLAPALPWPAARPQNSNLCAADRTTWRRTHRKPAACCQTRSSNAHQLCRMKACLSCRCDVWAASSGDR